MISIASRFPLPPATTAAIAAATAAATNATTAAAARSLCFLAMDLWL